MKFNVIAEGHKALVDLEADGKGNFTVSLDSDEYGAGNGKGVVVGDHYIGMITLKGHHPDIDATVSGNAIKGKIKLWPFPALNFEGQAA